MLIVVVAGIAIAALGIYLLIAGAVALIAWLAQRAARQPVVQPSAPRLVATQTSSTVPAPATHYRSVHPVDPNVFADTTMAEATAIDVFGAWARQLPKVPKDPTSLVRSLELRTRLIGRLTTKLEGRRFRWNEVPYDGRDRPSALPPDTRQLDPWNPPADLRSATRYVGVCVPCAGEGRIPCAPCAGTGRQPCIDCSGAGKVYGTTANGARRMLNCKQCRGKATVVCGTCTKGRLDCPKCWRSGKMERWLSVDGGARNADIQVEPDGDLTRAFVWGRDGVAATREEVAQDAKVLCEVTLPRVITDADLLASVPSAWTAEHWRKIQATLEPGEQVVEQTFTLLEVPSIEVTYALGTERQAIELEGLRMLAPPPGADALLTRRAKSLGRLMVALAMIPLATALVYLVRGSYFFTEGRALAVTAIIGCALGAAVLIYGGAWHATLGRRGARRWVLGAIGPIAIATTTAILVEPTVARARSLVAEGDVTAAKVELHALGARSDPDLAPLWNAVALKDTLAATTCHDAARAAGDLPDGAPEKALAQNHIDTLALAEADASLRASRIDEAEAALACGGRGLRESSAGRGITGRIAVAQGKQCVEARNWECALAAERRVSELGMAPEAPRLRAEVASAMRAELDDAVVHATDEADLAARVTLQQRAFALWTGYSAVDPQPEPPALVTLRRQFAKDEPALRKQEEVARTKAEADARKRRAAEEREEKRRAAAEARERRRQEAAERREAYRPLRCCDGTPSPSCTAGGSRRGCCSHHGGVCD